MNRRNGTYVIEKDRVGVSIKKHYPIAFAIVFVPILFIVLLGFFIHDPSLEKTALIISPINALSGTAYLLKNVLKDVLVESNEA